MNAVIERLTEILKDIQPYAEFDQKTDLLEGEVLDSVSILVWVQEMEDAFDIIIGMEEIKVENFKNIESAARLIQKKINGVDDE